VSWGALGVPPSTGVVDLFTESGEFVERCRVCMPRALDEAYAEQRARIGTTRQLSVNMISDVMIRDGVVYAMGSRPTDTGRYHIERFDLGGRALGSVVLYEPQIGVPDEVRFVSPHTFLAFSPVSGVVARFAVRRLGR
jgi:hypothetical protein